MRLNINDIVKVRLTPTGFRLHKEYWEKYYSKSKYKPPKIDESGYSSFQLWSLFEQFSKGIYMGALELPFETDLEI